MSAVSDSVLRWLYDILKNEYHDPRRTYNDIAHTLSQYPSISPRTDVHTFEHGSSALLLVLQGTIPAQFRFSTYRYPITVWLPYGYPQEPPMVYITPTGDMKVRPGQHVSMEGRVYHPYLANWAEHWNGSTISELLSILRDIFAKEPPVIARQQQIQRPQISASPQITGPTELPRPMSNPQLKPPPPPPKPMDDHASGPTRAMDDKQGSQSSSAPPLPPKPGQSSQLPQRTSSLSSNYTYHRPYSRSERDGPPPPPLPSLPSESRQMQHEGPSYDSRSSIITNGHQLRHDPGNQQQRVQPLPTQQHPTPHMYLPPQPLQGYQSSQSAHAPQQPIHDLRSQAYPQQHTGRPARQQVPQQSLQPKQPLPDLLSSPLEVTLPSQSPKIAPFPAPPIPPNPEKDALLSAISSTLMSQLSQTVAKNNSAVSSLLAQQAAIHQTHGALQSEMTQLQHLDAILTTNEQILHEAIREADRVEASLKGRKVPGVDEVLVAPTVVGEQLYRLVADERGIADAMFMLGRALDLGRVGGEVFVRHTRNLAREQFLKKALLRKIGRGMGLVVE